MLLCADYDAVTIFNEMIPNSVKQLFTAECKLNMGDAWELILH